MAFDVVAFSRRDRVVLGAVVGAERHRLELVAEDGARFRLPEDQVIARFAGLAGTQADGLAARLREVRAAAGRAPDWETVHGTLDSDAVVPFARIADAAGARDDAARLAVALGLSDAAPWIRRDGTGWRVVPRERALARLAAEQARMRGESEDAALLAWWPRRGAGPVPEGAAGALDALRAFAVRGETAETERGRKLAARIDLHEADPVLEALVHFGALPDDLNPASARAGLDVPFPGRALEEARALAAEPAPTGAREDLTALLAVAVDSPETTEVDDAISIRRRDGAFEILVHISDVAAAVPRDGALDRAVQARGSSLYVPDGNVTMFPAEAVSGRLSLDLGAVRDALTGFFVVADDGTVRTARFGRTRIRVTRRLAYEETADPASLAPSAEEGRALVALAAALRAERIRRGALVVNLSSLDVALRGGAPVVALRHQDTPGDLVVAESAVLHNCEAGRALSAADVPAFFRVQAAPRDGEPAPDDPLRPVLLRKRFAPTSLAVEPSRHHGVGSDHYAQASSPMRRYADLVNQRQLAAVAEGRPTEYSPAELETLGRRLSDRERAVRRASDDRADHWIARWFLPRQGGDVEGVLARAPRRGLGSVWVEELQRELPLRAPEGWKPPPQGTRCAWRVERVSPWRGRIELAPA